MLRDVNADQFFFPCQQLLARDLLGMLVEGKFKRIAYLFHISKQADHAAFPGDTLALAKLHRALHSIEQLVSFAVRGRVHRPCFNQGLNSSLADKFGIDARTKVRQRFEWSPLVACPYDFSNGPFSDTLDSKQAKAYSPIFYGETSATLVY